MTRSSASFVILLFSLFAAHLPAAEPAWGHLKGKILVDGKIPSQFLVRKGDPIYAPQSLRQNVDRVPPRQIGVQPRDIPDTSILVDEKTNGLKNVFVYLVKAPAAIHPSLAEVAKAPVEFRRTSIFECDPRCLFLQIGQAVRITNSSPETCGLHLSPLRNEAIVTTIGPGKSLSDITWKFPEKHPVTAKDDIHPLATAHWLILDHPYAALSAADGTFEIKNLPVGKHAFKIWHEKIGYLHKDLSVEIQADQTATVPTIQTTPQKLLGEKTSK